MSQAVKGGYLPGSKIEVINPQVPRGHIRHALFDFDGTISLIREGWQGVMIPMMVEILRQTPKGKREPPEKIEQEVTEFVTRLTGRQTIYQMLRLCEEVRRRGGRPLDPLEYKRMYHDRLWERIKGRLEALESGRVDADEMMVPGARAMLEELRARSVKCYLASGTDEPYVWNEARALKITHYFAGIYGALEDWKSYSKRQVIERIIRESRLSGKEFASFGDGFVEIEETKAVGGVAIGVASNEATRTGIDEWKRKRLIKAGADLIVPDFREHRLLAAFLFAEEEAMAPARRRNDALS